MRVPYRSAASPLYKDVNEFLPEWQADRVPTHGQSLHKSHHREVRVKRAVISAADTHGAVVAKIRRDLHGVIMKTTDSS